MMKNLSFRRADAKRDIEKLADFNGVMHGPNSFKEGNGNNHWAMWTRMMLWGEHPTATAEDFFLVENTQTQEIVSSLVVIPHVWLFDGVAFPVAQIEMVGTLPDYRRQGLVRKQFDLVHAECEQRGILAQCVGGLRYFYKQFGYEYALEDVEDKGLEIDVNRLPTDVKLPGYALKRLTKNDFAGLSELFQERQANALISSVCDEKELQYRLAPQTPYSVHERDIYVIVKDESIIGYFFTEPEGHHWMGSPVEIWSLIFKHGISYPDVVPWFMSQLRSLVMGKDCDKVCLALGGEHSIYPFLQMYDPVVEGVGGAWYMRVQDVGAFLGHVKLAFEKRIALSAVVHLNTTLDLDFYFGQVRLVFQDGHLVEVIEGRRSDEFENWNRDLFVPLNIFYKLLFGYKSLTEILDNEPECWVNEKTRPIIETLFPKRASWFAISP